MNFDDTAEQIIRLEGLTFALASTAGSGEDMREARELLKRAIVTALEEAARKGKRRDE